jgi:small conductance mechanosensitive channel
MRGYLSAIISEGRSQLTLQEFADSFLEWLVSPEGGVQVGFRIAVVSGSLFALLIVARIVRAWARSVFIRVPTLSKLLRGFLVMVVYWFTIAFGLMIVLAALGVDVTPLFALVGGASFILAFALQETLGNLAAGLMIMINRPFDEGDYVQIAGLGGTVRHVSVVSTTVTTPDNQVIVIPNSKVWGDVITNVTASETRRVDLIFGISYGDSIERAQRILEELVTNHPLVLKDPAPLIRVSALADSSVNFIVRPWVKTSDYWSVNWDLQRAVKEAFDANGISIPFPQTDIHLHVAESGTTTDPALAPALAGKNGGISRNVSGYASGDYGTDEPEENGSDRG